MNPSSPITHHAPPLSAYTCLALLVNRVIESSPRDNPTCREIFDAADQRRLIPLLADRYANLADFTWVTIPYADNLDQIEAALHDAAASFNGLMTTPASPLCLLLAITPPQQSGGGSSPPRAPNDPPPTAVAA